MLIALVEHDQYKAPSAFYERAKDSGTTAEVSFTVAVE